MNESMYSLEVMQQSNNTWIDPQIQMELKKQQKLADSGTRRDFGTGAVRDTDTLVNGQVKGRMDLFPVSLVLDVLGNDDIKVRDTLVYIDDFLETEDLNELLNAFYSFSEYHYGNVYDGLLAVSRQYQLGAAKYSSYNWAHGIPTHCYLDSALRHLLKFLRNSIEDEESQEIHAQAFLWNIICLVWTIKNCDSELHDITSEYNFKG